jgi:methyl-accepting chemotaxis protein
MNSVKRLLITLWLVLSLAGIVASLYGILQIWRIRPAATTNINELLTDGINVLGSTDEAILLISQALNNIDTSLNDLESSTVLIKESIHNTASMSSTFKVLLEEDFTVMAENTLIALRSSEKSATVIDATLEALSKVRFFGIPYDPETSLSFALGEIANEMEDMPEILGELSTSMDSTALNLTSLENQITDVEDNLLDMQSTMDDALDLTKEYRAYAQDAKSNLENLQNHAARWITNLSIALTIFCLILISSLLGAIFQAQILLKQP